MKPRKTRNHYHRGSSMVYLGFSIIMFLIGYGIGFLVLAQILGQTWTMMDSTHMPIPNVAWQAVYDDTQTQIQFIVPLAAGAGLVVFVIKLLMVASNRGRD